MFQKVALFALFLFTITAFAQDPTSTLVSIKDDPAGFLRQELIEAHLDVLPPSTLWSGEIRVVLNPGEEKILERLHIPYSVIEKGRPLLEILRGPEALDPKYYTLAEMNALLASLETAYPALAKVYNLTTYTGAPKTHENRDIFAIKISDNVTKDENEPNVLIVSEHHAREINTEVMTAETAKRLLQKYTSDPQIKAFVDQYEIWIIPIVNPDGVNYVWTKDNWWRKNRRNNGGGYYGVDPNRNYPFRWAKGGHSTHPGSNVYCGPSAGSEPCVKTVMALSEKHHFERVLDYHSYGREILFPYSRYSPNQPTAMKNYWNAAISDLMSASSYRTRKPSAAGEEPAWQIYKRGTLAFLVEVMTSFQPSYSSAITEEQTRVWPLVKKFLQFPTPMKGTVTDLAGRPVAAKIQVSGVNWFYGEEIRSGGPFGRYFVWAAPGTYSVTFSAPGFQSVTKKVVLSRTSSVVQDIVLLPVPALLTKSGTGKVGTTATFTLTASHDAGLPYFIPAALGTTPGIPMGPRTFPLNGDGLFTASTQMGAIFVGNVGTLNSLGKGTMNFQIPAWPDLAGFTFYFAGMTLDYVSIPHGVKSISNAVNLVITK